MTVAVFFIFFGSPLAKKLWICFRYRLLPSPLSPLGPFLEPLLRKMVAFEPGICFVDSHYVLEKCEENYTNIWEIVF